MKKKNLAFIFMSLALTTMPLGSSAAQTSFPIVEILGSKYYLYEAKKGDTLFGIARDNGWDDAELQRLNPAAVSPLKKGMKIYYPLNDEDAAKVEPLTLVKVSKTELSHVVKKGETVYSISQLYDIPVETIYSLNKSSKNGVRAGDTLILSKADSEQSESKADKKREHGYYTVKSGDTIYDVARQYGVSVAALLENNPGVSFSNFKPGSVIRIPARGSGIKTVVKKKEKSVLNSFEIYEAKKNETLSSIASKNGVDVDFIQDINPGIGEKLKKNQTIAIPRFDTVTIETTEEAQDPRELSEKGIQEIYEDVHNVTVSNTKETKVKVAILSETPSSNKDVEFIRGFLTGVNSLKDNGFKVDLKVVDGSMPDDDILNALNEFGPSLVFITYDKNVPPFVCEYASAARVPVVNAFDVKSEEFTTNPYFVQLLTPSNYFNDCVASNVYEKYGDYKLVLVGQEDSSDQLAASLRKYWNPSSITSVPETSLESFTMTDGGKYLFYGYSIKKTEVQKLLQDVNTIKESAPFADYLVLGRPNWIVFDSSLSEDLHRVNTYIPSRFYFDGDSESARQFSAAYKSLFNRNPVKSLPLYAGVGYDNATYFIPNMAENGCDINALTSSINTIQSEFDLKRVSNWGGFINPPVYLVRFTPFDTIDKIVIE